ncbi:hypothetical protein [Gordonia polyisoprenivorans]|uniref:hypothetical protein n=1 Tax=Gordonia polyisoprenivorans TaxID=84595 RepID=UPI00037B261A|nr:hypothetical protein [Gordonia polyisoprenivorans]OZC29609.1 hypothetical protein CJJ17_23250 [Gordonia polyisoprenivorans]
MTSATKDSVDGIADESTDTTDSATTGTATTDTATTDSDSTGRTTSDAKTTEKTDESKKDEKPSKTGRLAARSVSMRTLALGVLAVVVVAVIAVLSWRLVAVSGQVDDMKSATANSARAEKVALDYATGAAQMNYQNPDDWRTRLTQNTTPELADRLRKASQSMEQLIVPLQWSSTAEPIAAKVVSQDNGTYQVVAFVNVTTKNAQAPDGIESTATYKVTIDPNQNWQISEISGIGTNLGTGDDGNASGGNASGGNAPAGTAPGGAATSAPASPAPAAPAPAGSAPAPGN